MGWAARINPVAQAAKAGVLEPKKRKPLTRLRELQQTLLNKRIADSRKAAGIKS